MQIFDTALVPKNSFGTKVLIEILRRKLQRPLKHTRSWPTDNKVKTGVQVLFLHLPHACDGYLRCFYRRGLQTSYCTRGLDNPGCGYKWEDAFWNDTESIIYFNILLYIYIKYIYVIYDAGIRLLYAWCKYTKPICSRPHLPTQRKLRDENSTCQCQVGDFEVILDESVRGPTEKRWNEWEISWQMILVMLIYSSIFDKVTSCRIGVIVLWLSLSN